MIFFSKIFKKNRKKNRRHRGDVSTFCLKILKFSHHHICLRDKIEWFVFEKL